MKWVIEAGTSTEMNPLYWAKDDHVTNWTILIEIARKFDSEDDAVRFARKKQLVAPRFRSVRGQP